MAGVERRIVAHVPTQRHLAREAADWHGMLLDFCGGQVRTWSSAPVRAAAVLTMMNGGDIDYVLLVYRALVTNDLGDMTPSAHALVRAYMRGQIKAANPYDLFCRPLRVFDVTRRNLTRIEIRDQAMMIADMRHVVTAKLFGKPAGKSVGPQDTKRSALNGANGAKAPRQRHAAHGARSSLH
ncbi:hypothetical protein [Caballeronia novacaledonica]|uniref:Uncharacterized protein n=1 Tax=Caballeronia novacaledonica TaxID=1544861 RepID=A0AA37MQ24_9BURK|nr:hypothetical protein [Caballeronia novacaledonica]GJH25801.1 hypothetical protein CBA19CS42_14815 [Caballeronia novacaledonica]